MVTKRKTHEQRVAGIEAAHDALPAPKPGTKAYETLRDMGLLDALKIPQRLAAQAVEEKRLRSLKPTEIGREQRAMVDPYEHLRRENKSYLDAVARSAGRLDDDVSKATRARYAKTVAWFKRDGKGKLLLIPRNATDATTKLRAAQIMEAYIGSAGALPVAQHDKVETQAESFVRFVRREQAWVRKQLA